MPTPSTTPRPCPRCGGAHREFELRTKDTTVRALKIAGVKAKLIHTTATVGCFTDGSTALYVVETDAGRLFGQPSRWRHRSGKTEAQAIKHATAAVIADQKKAK